MKAKKDCFFFLINKILKPGEEIFSLHADPHSAQQ